MSNAQHRITMILKSLGIAIEICDISAPGMEEQRDFMRANATKPEGQRNVLPPQVFNGEKYCGVSLFQITMTIRHTTKTGLTIAMICSGL